jgi:hypothetical protein
MVVTSLTTKLDGAELQGPSAAISSMEGFAAS